MCCKPSPPSSPSRRLHQERVRPCFALPFVTAALTPRQASGRLRDGGWWGPASAAPIAALEIASELAPPTKAAKISFHLRQASWGLAVKRSLSRDAGRGRGPRTVYSCQNVSDRRLRPSCSSLAQTAGHAGSIVDLSVQRRAVIALGLVISRASLISPEDGSHPARGWHRERVCVEQVVIMKDCSPSSHPAPYSPPPSSWKPHFLTFS